MLWQSCVTFFASRSSLQKELSAATLPVQLHAFIDYHCANALQAPPALLGGGEKLVGGEVILLGNRATARKSAPAAHEKYRESSKDTLDTPNHRNNGRLSSFARTMSPMQVLERDRERQRETERDRERQRMRQRMRQRKTETDMEGQSDKQKSPLEYVVSCKNGSCHT